MHCETNCTERSSEMSGEDTDDFESMLAADKAERALQGRLLQVGVCIDFVERRAKTLAVSLGISPSEAARIITSMLLGGE